MEQARLPESFSTVVWDEALDRLFIEEGRKLGRAVKPRRARRITAMLDEARRRGVAPELLEFYKRTVYESFFSQMAAAPRGNTYGRVKHSPADGRQQPKG